MLQPAHPESPRRRCRAINAASWDSALKLAQREPHTHFIGLIHLNSQSLFGFVPRLLTSAIRARDDIFGVVCAPPALNAAKRFERSQRVRLGELRPSAFQYRALGTCLMDVPTVLSNRSELRVNAKLHADTGLAADKFAATQSESQRLRSHQSAKLRTADLTDKSRDQCDETEADKKPCQRLVTGSVVRSLVLRIFTVCHSIPPRCRKLPHLYRMPNAIRYGQSRLLTLYSNANTVRQDACRNHTDDVTFS